MARIRSTLAAQEIQAGTTRDQWIRVLQNPQRPVVAEGTGNRHRAMLAALVLGLMLTLSALQFFQDGDGLIRRSVRLVRRLGGRKTPVRAPPAHASGRPSGQPQPTRRPQVGAF